MKPVFLFLSLCCYTITNAQLTIAAKKELKAQEEKMKGNAAKILYAIAPEERMKSDSIFTRQFVQALKTPHSFYYPFDSLVTISALYAPDSTFRIFTWQLVMNDFETRQHGAIQLQTQDGSLKLFPLIDKSDVIENATDTTTDNNSWIGAVYYKIILKENGDKKYYTLLGYDENNFRSTKKIIEVLEFRNGTPWFGARKFQVPDNNLQSKSTSRYIMEFKKDAGPRLMYDADLDMIVMEHLISEINDTNKKYTMVGDGDYEGFKWQNGNWNYISKIFTQVTPEGQAPMPTPIRDAAGNVDETKLVGYEADEQAPAPKKATKTAKKKSN